MPRNKFTLFALLWAAASVYAVLRRDLGTPAIGLPDTLSLTVFAATLGQILLLGKAFRSDGKKLPLIVLYTVPAAFLLLRLLRNLLSDFPWATGLPATFIAVLSAIAAAALLRPHPPEP